MTNRAFDNARVWRLGADVDTDALAPGTYMKHGLEVIGWHCLEAVRTDFASGVREGDVIVAGANFGIGSSREQAAGVLRHLGLAAVIASARLNSATNALGTLDELYVIAAAVIGGTSLAGGLGTIYGAILGALVMQSLQSGMVLIGFDSAVQRIVVGLVLVLAVYLDNLYRRKSK